MTGLQGVFPEGRVEVKEPIAKIQNHPPVYSVVNKGGECNY